jgi:pyrrolidone-carboxylate peptidase
MRRLFFSACVLLLASSCTQSRQPNRQKDDFILVTAFQPFGKWKVNLSNEVALELKKKMNIEVCELPVVYDKAADAAVSCFQRLKQKPKLILGLGEGSCALRLETSAANLDDTPGFADNAGTVRKSTAIIPGAPEKVSFSIPYNSMYCGLSDADRKKITPSTSAGNYVCNNTAYRLSRYFKDTGIPYGFIHVPHSGCPEELRDPKANAALIEKMLNAALASETPAPACSSELQTRLKI